MRYAYPVVLDVTQRLIVIIGGGAVAARKAKGLMKAGARRIRVVAPVFHPSLPATIERVTAMYDPSQLDGSDLVFAATDRPEVNEAVVRDARFRGILVARADGEDNEPGDFATPAHFREGSVLVGVSVGSAALSAKIRDCLAERFDPSWAVMADLMTQLRPRIKATLRSDPARRSEVLKQLATDEAMSLAGQGEQAVWAWLCHRFPELSREPHA